MKFGEMLIKEGLITREQLNLALERQVVFGGRIGTNLIELGFVSEDVLTQKLSKYHKLSAADATLLNDIPDDTIKTISAETAEKYGIIPFRVERKRLHVAIINIKNASMIDELKFRTGYDIVPYVGSEIRILYALEKYYGIKRDLRFISLVDNLKKSEDKKQSDPGELKKIKEAFKDVKDKEEIAGIVLSEAKKVASRIALFVIKGNTVEGWISKGCKAEGFSAQVEPHSVVAEIIEKRSFYRGPLLNVPGNKPLLSLLGGTPQDCFMMPMGIRDKIVGILFADNGNDRVLTGNLHYLHTLVSLASLAFEIVILRKKISDL